MLGKSGYNPVVQLVGLLHDVVEDTGRTVDDVRAYFGDTVAQIVAELTEDDRIRAVADGGVLTATLIEYVASDFFALLVASPSGYRINLSKAPPPG